MRSFAGFCSFARSNNRFVFRRIDAAGSGCSWRQKLFPDLNVQELMSRAKFSNKVSRASADREFLTIRGSVALSVQPEGQGRREPPEIAWGSDIFSHGGRDVKPCCRTRRDSHTPSGSYGMSRTSLCTEIETDPVCVRILLLDILKFDGFFSAESNILKPRWLPTGA
jgi:hypothetical protein